jgi:hypothetical protein
MAMIEIGRTTALSLNCFGTARTFSPPTIHATSSSIRAFFTGLRMIGVQ